MSLLVIHSWTKQQKPAKKSDFKNSWNWLVMLLPTTIWQILNIKCVLWPETEVMWICWNLLGKTREITLSELIFGGFLAIWNHCVVIPETQKILPLLLPLLLQTILLSINTNNQAKIIKKTTCNERTYMQINKCLYSII